MHINPHTHTCVYCVIWETILVIEVGIEECAFTWARSPGCLANCCHWNCQIVSIYCHSINSDIVERYSHCLCFCYSKFLTVWVDILRKCTMMQIFTLLKWTCSSESFKLTSISFSHSTSNYVKQRLILLRQLYMWYWRIYSDHKSLSASLNAFTEELYSLQYKTKY